MINANDILRSLRYTLNINDATMLEVFALTGFSPSAQELASYLAKEEDANFVECNHHVLARFLDGLIIKNRGQKEGTVYEAPKANIFLSNNVILKKLRIAFELQEDEMLGIMALAGFNISRQELGALFRKEGHHNYRECGDQFLRNFLKGLTLRYRKT